MRETRLGAHGTPVGISDYCPLLVRQPIKRLGHRSARPPRGRRARGFESRERNDASTANSFVLLAAQGPPRAGFSAYLGLNLSPAPRTFTGGRAQTAGILDDNGTHAVALDPIQKGREPRACLDRVRTRDRRVIKLFDDSEPDALGEALNGVALAFLAVLVRADS